LAECRLDIVSMSDDVQERVICPEGVNPSEEGFLDGSKEAGLLGAGRSRRHHVNWRRPWGISTGGIKELAILLACLLQDMLGGEEEMWREPSYPMRKRNDVVVPILFVHGREDLREFFVN